MIETILAIAFTVSIFTHVFWGILAILPQRQTKLGHAPPMSVILPAHNEEAAIRQSVESVLSSKYPGEIEVLVVNDGSTDSTAEIVKDMGAKDFRVRKIDTPHLGKSMAVNRGVAHSSGEIIVLLDADSELGKDSLLRLAEPFKDEKTGAVSGIIRVVPTKNPLAWYQEFEYILSSMWRYIFDRLDCTYVLPGFAAFRRSALKKANGFETDTLSEDFDIGLKMHKSGFNIRMSRAVIYTNVPQTLKGLARQRLRWGRGTVQVIRKHRDMILNPSYGFIGLYGLPNQIYFLLQSAVILPITFYQIFDGYMKWFAGYGDYLSWGVIRYFFSYLSMFGTFEYIHKVYSGVWQPDWLFPLFLYSFIFSQAYHLLSIRRVGIISHRLIFSMLFLFPYYLFTLLFFIYPLMSELSPFKKRRAHVNIWEKTR